MKEIVVLGSTLLMMGTCTLLSWVGRIFHSLAAYVGYFAKRKRKRPSQFFNISEQISHQTSLASLFTPWSIENITGFVFKIFCCTKHSGFIFQTLMMKMSSGLTFLLFQLLNCHRSHHGIVWVKTEKKVSWLNCQRNLTSGSGRGM